MDRKRKMILSKKSYKTKKKSKPSSVRDVTSFANGSVLISTVLECQNATKFLQRYSEIAIDMEGVAHGRDGSLSLIQMTAGSRVPNHMTVFLFDITVLGRAAFEEGGLRQLLEEKHIQKVVFDVRTDADSLFHNYGVEMCNVYDIQVLYMKCFSESTGNFLKGLDKAIKTLSKEGGLSQKEMISQKQLGVAARNLFTKDMQIWNRRPLPQMLCDYATSGVMHLQQMKALWGWSDHQNFVSNTSEERKHKFVARKIQIQGREKARLDFNLITNNSYDSDGPRGVCDICDYDSDSGLCEY